jgi:precorrin-2 dehydrogenase / sirohydrochlorin ferrochelatase
MKPMRNKNPGNYPVLLKTGNKKCVVVGGGMVALRKVKTLLQYGAVVRVISPRICKGLSELAQSGNVSLVKRVYQNGDIDGSFLVIIATGSSRINKEILREARNIRILVNTVNDPEECDFIVPASFQRGDITISISTNGKSPALARKLKTAIEKEFGKEYVALVSLVNEIRSDLKRRKIKTKSSIWQKALDLNLLVGLIHKGQVEEARRIVYQKLLGTEE